MRDLFVDPVTGDLAIAAGRLRLTEPGVEAVAQRLRVRLRSWRGEWFLDRKAGIPYADLLGRKGALADLEATLRRAATTCPGVAALVSLTLAVDARRHATVALVARALDGTPVTLEPFSIGSV